MHEQPETRSATLVLSALESELEGCSETTLSLAAAIKTYSANIQTGAEPLADLFRALALARDLRRTILEAAPETHRKGRRRFGDWNRRALPSLMAHVHPIGSKKKPSRSLRIDRALNAPS